jgi:hypothetical protein
LIEKYFADGVLALPIDFGSDFADDPHVLRTETMSEWRDIPWRLTEALFCFLFLDLPLSLTVDFDAL